MTGNNGLQLVSKTHDTNPEQRIPVITTAPKHFLRMTVKETGFLHEKDISTTSCRLMDFASLIGDSVQNYCSSRSISYSN